MSRLSLPDEHVLVARPRALTARTFVIAEIGSNHNRDLAEAHRLIDAAAAAGCDAAKFQTYSADTLYSRLAPRLSEMDSFNGDDGTITPHALISRLELPREWHVELAAHCEELGIEFMSTPFDLAAVVELDPLVRVHKLASFDLTHRQLVEAVAACGKPLILSTGHAFLGEVESAIAWVRAIDDRVPISLLHCTSHYPTPPAEVNLNAMTTLADAFGCTVGLSDHTLGIVIPAAAVALGARIVEKHFTSDPSFPGPDHAFALDPPGMTQMVSAIRDVEAALGSRVKAPVASELENRALARRSVHAAVDLAEGTELRPEHLTLLRPGTGVAPEDLDRVLGRRVHRSVVAGTPVTWDLL